MKPQKAPVPPSVLVKTGEKRLKPVRPLGSRTGPAMIGFALDCARSTAILEERNFLKSVPIIRSFPKSGKVMRITASGAALTRTIWGFCRSSLVANWSKTGCGMSGAMAKLLAMPRRAVMLLLISLCSRVEVRLSSLSTLLLSSLWKF